MPNTLYSNSGFRSGLWDDDYRHSLKKEGYSEALLEALNVSLSESGSVRRRPNFFKMTGFSTAAWAAPSSSYSASDEVLLIPFVTRKRWILVVQVNPANATILWVVPYDVDANSFESRITVTNTVFGFDAAVRGYQFEQAGQSMFIATRPDLVDPPGLVVRVYDDGSGPLNIEVVEFHHELSGLWYYVAGSGNVIPMDQGTTHNAQNAGTTVAITDGVTDAKNFAPAENEITAAEELFLARSVPPDSGNWCNIGSVDDEVGTISGRPFNISLTDPANPIHLSQFTPKWRHGTAADRYQGANCVTFYEGRLVLANTRSARSALSYVHEPTKMYFSALFDPYLIYPSPINGFADSPIETDLWSPLMGVVQWVRGSEQALFIGGNRGLSVIRPGITRAPQQVSIDSIGADDILPVIEQSGIIYQSADLKYIVRVDYQDTNGGYRVRYLNGNTKKQINDAIKLQLGTGYSSCPRCVYAVLDDGTMGVGHLFEDGAVSWSLYDTELGDIIDVVAIDSEVYALIDSGSGLALMRLDENDDYAGDNQETAALSSGRWKLADSGNFSAKVAVTARVGGGATQIHLGVFGTTASGYIQDGDMDLGDMYDTLTNVVCYRTFESIVTPMPAIPTASEGSAFGVRQRVVRAYVGFSETRNFNLNNKLAFKIVNLGAVQTEREQNSGVVEFEGGGEHSHELIDTITADGAHQFTVTSLIREVSA